MRSGSGSARFGRAAIMVAVISAAAPALAAPPYVGFWADNPKDCAAKTVPPLTQVEEGAAYWDGFFCPTATFTPDGASWKVHIECVDPMAGPGADADAGTFDYRFTVDGDTLHWDPIGEGTGSVLKRCPA